MASMYLMCGLSGSGKTTYAKAFAKLNNIRYLGIDEFYKATFGSENIHEHEYDVWMMFYRAIQIAGEQNVSVIIDTNSPTKANREEIYNWFGHMFNQTTLVYMDTPVTMCYNNNSHRVRKVPRTEMENMVKKFEIPEDKEVFGSFVKVAWKDE